MTSTNEQFHVPIDVARAYESTFVPAIFAEWAPHTARAADVATGHDVLDVACGTGIVARTAIPLVGPTGSVTGVDRNEAMLAVAAEIEPEVAWREGAVDDLPFEENTFDSTTCQMAFMFFPDRVAAFAELGRVTRRTGRIGITVPASLDRQPAYRPFVDAAARHAGPDAVSLLSTYWNCGDLDGLSADAERAGLRVVDRRTRTGACGFRSAAEFVEIEVTASPLAERLDPSAMSAIIDDVSAALHRPDSAFGVPLVGHLLSLEPAG